MGDCFVYKCTCTYKQCTCISKSIYFIINLEVKKYRSHITSKNVDDNNTM